MTKTIVCPECNGFGYIEEHVDGLLYKKECGCCGGARILRVPVTNADRIRNMSDEELSVFLWRFDLEEVAREDGGFLVRKKITEWLQKPVED